MLLGRTFDYSKSEVGNDIISEEERKKAQTILSDRADIKYKMVKSSEDIRDVLDVSGQLSVKVMAGTVDIEGKGSYLKSSVDSKNSVQVMVQVYYKTVRFRVIYIAIQLFAFVEVRICQLINHPENEKSGNVCWQKSIEKILDTKRK